VVLGARLTVLGSLNMDISVTVARLPAPGATVLGGAAAYAPGGKGANQAVAAARLGGAVRMVGCVGDDEFGARLRAALDAESVDATAVRTVPAVPTGLAMITVDGAGENIITVAPGANREVGAPEIAAVGAVPADVLVISAEIPVPVIKAVLAAELRTPHTPTALTAPAAPNTPTAPNMSAAPSTPDAPHTPTAPSAPAVPPIRLLNLAPAPPEAAELVALGVDWLVVNESEAGAVLGWRVAGLAGAALAAAELANVGARHAVVTAGAAGAAYCGQGAGEPSGVVTVPGFPVRAVDTVGAGDTFVGALAVALAAGIAPPAAVRAAAAAGAAAATRAGTQSGMPRAGDVLAATGHPWPVPAP
jgi:ribokinase